MLKNLLTNQEFCGKNFGIINIEGIECYKNLISQLEDE